MIRGAVNSRREAIVPLRVRGPSAVSDEVLLGMRLLANHELRIAVVPGGAVEITPVP